MIDREKVAREIARIFLDFDADNPLNADYLKDITDLVAPFLNELEARRRCDSYPLNEAREVYRLMLIADAHMARLGVGDG